MHNSARVHHESHRRSSACVATFNCQLSSGKLSCLDSLYVAADTLRSERQSHRYTQLYNQSAAASTKMSEKGAMSPDKALFGQVMLIHQPSVPIISLLKRILVCS